MGYRTKFPTQSYQRSRFQSSPAKDYSQLARKFMLFLIPFAILIMAFVFIYIAIFNPERQVPAKFEALATNYYENIFYENLQNSPNYPGDAAEALQKYTETGLATVTLQQLIHYNQISDTDEAKYLLKYCDDKTTKVKFYPEAPFEKTSYRTEYTYNCNF